MFEASASFEDRKEADTKSLNSIYFLLKITVVSRGGFVSSVIIGN